MRATVYFAGDTAYHDLLAAAVGPHEPQALVAVINLELEGNGERYLLLEHGQRFALRNSISS